jgi:CRP-like cAMP-binding protein
MRMELLTEEESTALEGVGHSIRYTSGSILFGEGEETDFTLLIRKGHVKVTSGTSEHIVAIRGPRETVGEMAAIDGEPRSASIFAMSEVEALYIPGRAWLDFLYEHPRVMHALLQAVGERLREATRKQAEHGYIGVEQRLAKGLVELQRKIGEPVPDGVAIGPLSQVELAGLVGASREAISQVMKTFRLRDVVATGRQKVIIRDLETLKKIARGELTSTH